MTENSIFRSIQVLVVEDEAFSLETISKTLQQIGVSQILKAQNGIQALELMEDTENAIDLIISDIEMPEMGGYEFVRHIRYGKVPQYKAIPILMLTGHDTPDNIQKARIHKIDGFIVKPPKAEEFKKYIQIALGL
ncbi:MAG: response regulator [Rhodospirillales bacterium]|jgi:two-component system, chemotaxis family, chemotaxis protein CheY|nr:response regulator [Rhodospirillales bacterium]